MNTPAAQPTLRAGASLAQVADILRFAAVFGSNEESRPHSPTGVGDNAQHPLGSFETDFSSAVSALFHLLHDRGIRYLLVGGVALLRYVPGRNTDDIDLLLAVEELRALPEIQLEEQSSWFAKGRFQGLRVDLLFTSNPLFSAVQERHSSNQVFLEMDVPCATPAGLILLKLYALPSLYRQGDLQRANLYESDIAALLLSAKPPMEPLFEELTPHVSASDLAELRKIVAEAQTRERRFDSTP